MILLRQPLLLIVAVSHQVNTICTTAVGDSLIVLQRTPAGLALSGYSTDGSGSWKSPPHPWLAGTQGWANPAYHDTIRLLSVGCTLYVLARGSSELHVASFNTESRAWNCSLPGLPAMTDADGWHGKCYYSTMRACEVAGTLYVIGR